MASGRSAPRVLNVCAVGTSVTMNVLAAGHGWRDLAIWAMPPIAYALASDTAIGVVRAWTIARQRALNEALADDGTSPLAIVGGLLLWTLRLDPRARLPPSSGFRRWVIEECPVAPGRRAADAATQSASHEARRGHRAAITVSRRRSARNARAAARGRNQDPALPGPRGRPARTAGCLPDHERLEGLHRARARGRPQRRRGPHRAAPPRPGRSERKLVMKYVIALLTLRY